MARIGHLRTILWESQDQIVEVVRSYTEGRGADACIDAAGMEADRDFLDKVKALVNVEKAYPKYWRPA